MLAQSSERILLEDYVIPIKSIELDETKTLLNINFSKSQNRSGATIKFEIVDYDVFSSSDRVNFYLQDLYFELNDVNIYQHGDLNVGFTFGVAKGGKFGSGLPFFLYL